MKLIDEKQFLMAITQFMQVNKQSMWLVESIKDVLSIHLIDIKDESHYPSGKDRDKINNRNELREELRNEKPRQRV